MIVVAVVFVDLEIVVEDATQALQAMSLATDITTTTAIAPLYVVTVTAASSSQATLAAENLKGKQ